MCSHGLSSFDGSCVCRLWYCSFGLFAVLVLLINNVAAVAAVVVLVVALAVC